MSKLKLSLSLTIANIPVLLAFVFGNWFFLGLIPSVIIAVWMIYHETGKMLFPKKGFSNLDLDSYEACNDGLTFKKKEK